MVQLRNYQKDLVEKALFKLNLFNKVCMQLATGGGKTVIFSEIAKNYKGNVLILVDSQELVEQTAKTIKADTFEAKNKLFPTGRIVVGMTPTIWSRLKKTPNILKHFDLVIIDEAHVWIHNKLFDFCKIDCKFLGVTATPVRLQRKTFLVGDDEWTREETMSEVYDDIICGVGIDFLIENNFLVDEETYTIKVDSSKLKTDSTGEFTNDSINSTFANEKYSIDVLNQYKEICLDKKTMIFTPNTTINLNLFELFISNGFNCKMYDSVNSKKNERTDIVNWFKNTANAILFNVSCFTKGFDVTDVEAIILARPTASLSLFIQIAGRGSRTTDKIYKDRFIFIDGGGNVERFGLWSSNRDWEKIFFKGLKPPKIKSEALENPKFCPECDFIMSRGDTVCSNCGHEIEIKEREEKETIKEVQRIKAILPKAKNIIRYTISKAEDKFFALKVLDNLILNLFISYKITAGNFENTLHNNNFIEKMNEIYRPQFYAIVHSELHSLSHRTYKKQLDILTNKLKKHYGLK